MNMVYEGLRQKGSMIIVPSTAVETMGLGALGGLTAFGHETPSAPGAPADASSEAKRLNVLWRATDHHSSLDHGGAP